MEISFDEPVTPDGRGMPRWTMAAGVVAAVALAGGLVLATQAGRAPTSSLGSSRSQGQTASTSDGCPAGGFAYGSDLTLLDGSSVTSPAPAVTPVPGPGTVTPVPASLTDAVVLGPPSPSGSRPPDSTPPVVIDPGFATSGSGGADTGCATLDGGTVTACAAAGPDPDAPVGSPGATAPDVSPVAPVIDPCGYAVPVPTAVPYDLPSDVQPSPGGTCSPGQVREELLTDKETYRPGETVRMTLALTNVSASPCGLPGKPTFTVYGENGDVVWVTTCGGSGAGHPQEGGYCTLDLPFNTIAPGATLDLTQDWAQQLDQTATQGVVTAPRGGYALEGSLGRAAQTKVLLLG